MVVAAAEQWATAWWQQQWQPHRKGLTGLWLWRGGQHCPTSRRQYLLPPQEAVAQHAKAALTQQVVEETQSAAENVHCGTQSQ